MSSIDRRIELNVKNKFNREVMAKIAPDLIAHGMAEWKRLCDKRVVDPDHNMEGPVPLVLNGFPELYGKGILAEEFGCNVPSIPENSCDLSMVCKDCGSIFFYRQRTNVFGNHYWAWMMKETGKWSMWSLCDEIRMDSALS